LTCGAGVPFVAWPFVVSIRRPFHLRPGLSTTVWVVSPVG
jgi:hypothetical protein